MKVGYFGAAIPLFNYRFNIAKRWTTTYTSFSSGTLTVPIPQGGAEDGANMLGKGDSPSIGGYICKVVLGPSTHANNLGAVEEHTILAGGVGVAGTSITFDIKSTTLTNSYTVGDPVTITGPGLPEGWRGTNTVTKLTHGFSYGSILTTDGLNSPYGFEIRSVVGSATNYCTFDLKKVFPVGAWVRLGIKYKMKNLVGTTGLRVILYESSTFTVVPDINSTSIILDISDDSDTYVEDSLVFKVPDTNDVRDQPFAIGLYIPATNSMDYCKIAGISLTHSSYASGTYSTTHTNFASGYSLIDEYPLLGSVKVVRNRDNKKLLTNIDGRYYAPSVLNRQIMPITRYQISYELDSPSAATISVLQKLIDFQNRGYLLNHFPQMDGVPYYLTGRLEIKMNKKYYITDLTRERFQLVFTEVPV